VANRRKEEPLDASLVGAALDAQAPRFRVEIIDTCESTNTLLLDRAQAGAPSGSVVACERQTAGRGRRGRNWLSAPGASLTFSLLWRFPPGTAPLTGLSLAVAVALVRALTRLNAPGIRLKWPNDILMGDAKLGGILVETLSGGGAPVAVIGIGLNVRLPRQLAEAITGGATDLASVMPTPPSRNLLLARLLDELGSMLTKFARCGFSTFTAEWLSYHAYTGRTVHILSDGLPPLQGRCAGVDNDGALLLETAAGVRRVVSGEVSLRVAR
jgi:BirA family biotin operon repressor/biotin-[acetyl-CoA-carboxylase] ligase